MKQNTILCIEDLVSRYSVLSAYKSEILNAIEQLVKVYKNDGKLLLCGNGGSAADSIHIVGELMKSFKLHRPISQNLKEHIMTFENGADLAENLQNPLSAISLVCESGLMTAFENDVNPEYVFAQQVLGYGKKGDCLLAISTSGNSKNVIYAAEVAKAMGIYVLGLTGENGGKLKNIADICIAVPETETYKIQELHLPVYHAICLALENEFFGRNK